MKVCIVIYGLTNQNQRLQPWRYILEVANQLSTLGHQVTLITENKHVSPEFAKNQSYFVKRVHSVRNFWWKTNQELIQSVHSFSPDMIIWSVGLTSFLHQKYWKLDDCLQIGILSSPIYSLIDLLRIGIPKLLANLQLSGIHIAGALIPHFVYRKAYQKSGLDWVVTQTQTTQQRFKQIIGKNSVEAIYPGVDDVWLDQSSSSPEKKRAPIEILFMGSPAPMRGLPILIEAMALVRKEYPNIILKILNRKYAGELEHETEAIEKQIDDFGMRNSIIIENGFLGQSALVAQVKAASAVALPFVLIPSDAPLAALEITALGKPLITSDLGCLPEITAGGRTYFCKPGDRESLKEALLQCCQDIVCNEQCTVLSHKSKVTDWTNFGKKWAQLILNAYEN